MSEHNNKTYAEPNLEKEIIKIDEKKELTFMDVEFKKNIAELDANITGIMDCLQDIIDTVEHSPPADEN